MIKTPTDRPLTNRLLVGTTLFLKDLNKKKKNKNIKDAGSRKIQLDRVLGNVIFGTAFCFSFLFFFKREIKMGKY